MDATRESHRPRVYFEEWDGPLISGIRWVSELIGIASGEERFRDLTTAASAKNRIIADPNKVVGRAPDIMSSLASWCGARFRPERVKAGEGSDSIPAVRTGHPRDQVRRYPATGARRAHRGAGPDPPHHRALGRGG